VSEWEVLFTDQAGEFLDQLRTDDWETYLLVNRAILVLECNGPAEGRPLVDTISGSAISNLKELRPGSTGRTEIRILFAFDPWRAAILLVAGDKAGRWRQWYDEAIAIAERLYEDYVLERRKELNR
jgi:hypothetical protein